MWVKTCFRVQFWRHFPAQTPQVIDRVLYKLDDMAWSPDKLKVNEWKVIVLSGPALGFFVKTVGFVGLGLSS